MYSSCMTKVKYSDPRSAEVILENVTQSSQVLYTLIDKMTFRVALGTLHLGDLAEVHI